MARLTWLLSAAVTLAAAGCSPTIGDGCSTSLNCSVNNDRACDTTVRGGLCTVFNCEPGTCPDGATCVEWRPEPSRLAFTACMRPCGDDDDCRTGDGFCCVDPSGPRDPNAEASSCAAVDLSGVAQIVEGDEPETPRFCVATDGG